MCNAGSDPVHPSLSFGAWRLVFCGFFCFSALPTTPCKSLANIPPTNHLLNKARCSNIVVVVWLENGSATQAKPDEWEIDRADIELLSVLGAGNFGEVRLGRLKGRVDVAVKTTKKNKMTNKVRARAGLF
jgi:hypothetical protein